MSNYDKPSDWMETPNAGTLMGVDPYAEWKKIQRTAEMQSAIMADPERTGGWPGAQRVSDAFADLAYRVSAVISAAMGNTTSRIEALERELSEAREMAEVTDAMVKAARAELPPFKGANRKVECRWPNCGCAMPCNTDTPTQHDAEARALALEEAAKLADAEMNRIRDLAQFPVNQTDVQQLNATEKLREALIARSGTAGSIAAAIRALNVKPERGEE